MCRLAVLTLAFPLLAVPPAAGADTFDRYTNPVLMKAPEAAGVRPQTRLSFAAVVDDNGAVPGIDGTLLVVRTNDGLYGKLVVEGAYQKVGVHGRVPVLFVKRYVTYRLGQDEAVLARGENVKLFSGFRLSLDIGQVVPKELGGDLRVVADRGKLFVEPLGKAKLYLVTRPLPGTEAKHAEKFVVGGAFQPRYFNGTYRLHDDGRRSGKLTLKVGPTGDVTGVFYSDKDGQQYEVAGKVGTPNYSIEFTIKFPRVVETLHGWMFTGDGRAIAGTARLQDHEAGFYAVRE
jgi:hypothetical protein